MPVRPLEDDERHDSDEGGRGAKKPKYQLDDTDDAAEEQMSKDVSFWMPSYNRDKDNSVTTIGSAWLPYLEVRDGRKPFSVEHDLAKPVLTYQLCPLVNKGNNNLLDIFKEIDVCQELIPPRPNQPSLKSPTPMALPDVSYMPATTANVPAPTSRLQEMLSRTDYPGAAVGTVAPAHIQRTERHYSTGMGESILGELDAITKLSNSLTSQQSIGDHSSSALSTPTEERFGPGGELIEVSRRRSIQDSIDSVARGSPQDASNSSPLSPFLPQASFAPHSPVKTAAHRGQTAQRAPTAHPHGLGGPSRSFDFDFSRQRSTDVFDFEKSEEVTFPTTPLTAPPTNPGFFQNLGAPVLAPTGVAGVGGRAGRGGGRGRGRGRGRGTRQLSADGTPLPPKEPKKRGATGAVRRPRKPRGAPAVGGSVQVVTSELPHVTSQAKTPTGQLPPSHFPNPMIPPFSSYEKPAPIQLLAPLVSASPVDKTPPALTPSKPLLPQLIKEEPLASAGIVSDRSSPMTSLKQSPVDNSPEQTSDSLRNTIRNVLKSEELCNIGTEVNKMEESRNIFENIAGSADMKHLLEPTTTSAPGVIPDDDSNSRTGGQCGSRTKPNILSKTTARKGSLDLVIGKLTEQATSRISVSDLYDDEVQHDDDDEAQLPSAIGPESVLEEETNSRSPVSTGGPEGSDAALKVVIRRAHLQSSPTNTTKPAVSRQKSDSSDNGSHPSKSTTAAEPKIKLLKQKSVDRTADSNKGGTVKQKVASRKRKAADGSEKTATKASKISAKGSTLPSFQSGQPIVNRSLLSGFRIPKVVEEKSAPISSSIPASRTPQSSTAAAAAPPSRSAPPAHHHSTPSVTSALPKKPTHSQKSKPSHPRSILKNSSSAQGPSHTSAPVQYPSAAAVLGAAGDAAAQLSSLGRKPLLPDPFLAPPQPTTAPTTTSVRPSTVFLARPPIARGQMSPVTSGRMDWQTMPDEVVAEIGSPDAPGDNNDTVQSPDQPQPLLVDESTTSSITSDGTLDTSKDVDPLSPQLTIADAD